jgi:outer membrane protein assembly factor BamB
MGASITTDPVNADGIVVVADSAGHVAAFNPLRGALLWKQDTFETITAHPAYSERQVYVASEDQALYCFDRASGEELWKYLTESPLTTSPTVVDGRVYQYVETEGLVALDTYTGEKVWTLDLKGRPLMTRNNQLVIHVPGRYVERDGNERLLAERLLTVDPASGETIEESWLPRVQEIRTDRAENGNLYLIRRDGRIMKLSPQR